MKILITGTSGFLGKSLQEYFSDHEVFSWNRSDGDLEAYIDTVSPDVMINCAAEIYDPAKMLESNVILVYKILECLRLKHPATRLIQIGSGAEYGIVGRATHEKDRIDPVNMYQATKGSSTLMCQSYARQYGLRTCVIRMYNGYGVHERPCKLFPRLYRAFFQNEPFTLYAGEHDFIYIDDFCRGVKLVLEKDWPVGEIVNLGSGIQTSNLQVLRTWEKITQRTANIKYHDIMARSYESTVWCCNTDYALKQYGFSAEYSLEQGIKDMILKLHEVNTNGSL